MRKQIAADDEVMATLAAREKECLAYYFKLDTWTVREAICLLCRLDPRTTQANWPDMRENWINNTLSLHSYFPFDESECISILDEWNMPRAEYFIGSDNDTVGSPYYIKFHETESKLENLRKLWASRPTANLNEERFTPIVFICWAIEKDYEIAWLEWAKSEGFITDVPMKKQVAETSKTTLPANTRILLLKIIAGLMKAHFPTIDPLEEKFTGRNLVEQAMDKAHIKIDMDMASKYIKEAESIRRQLIDDAEEIVSRNKKK